MEHTIIIWEKLKERDSEGKYRYRIVSRYQLTEEEICKQETAKHIEDLSINEDSEYEYYAAIEETKY